MQTPLRTILLCLGALWLLESAPVALGQNSGAPATGRSVAGTQDGATLDSLIAQLGDDEYERREAASRAILILGPAVSPALEAHLAATSDPEVRFRLRYILEHIRPPERAVLLIRAARETGLAPGDLITHVNSRRVRAESELRQLLGDDPRGARLSVFGVDGPRETGPLFMGQLEELADYVAPRGPDFARALRLYAQGFAEQAYALVQSTGGPGPEEQWPQLLHARLAYTAGDAPAAFEALRGQEDSVRPIGADWNSDSVLDRSGPGKAPFLLEWKLFSEDAGPRGQRRFETHNDRDLRVQRVLVPAHRTVDALLAAAALWNQMQSELGADSDTNRVAGNQLAVCGWMLYDLDLRSECCRLVEPRSRILRTSQQGVDKWIRVETDAWLPFLNGDTQLAVDGLYEPALDILRHPPRPDEVSSLIRNPAVAARLALFLYRLGDEQKLDEALTAVNVRGHVALADYATWMLTALDGDAFAAVRRHLDAMLPNFSDGEVLPFARAAALLEYVADRPQDDVFLAARQRAAESRAADREGWVAQIEVLRRLAAGEMPAARAALAAHHGSPDAAALESTVGFRENPPPSAAAHDALRAPLLAVERREGDWLILARDRRLLRFDSASGTLEALAGAPADWFPGPLTWPWIGCQRASGRAWIYELRRLIEVTPGGGEALRLNIATADIPDLDRCIGPAFDRFANLARSAPLPAGETSEFLRVELRANRGFAADPDLPEIGSIEPVAGDPRLVQVAVRGGPEAIVDTERQRLWSSAWLAEAAGLERPPRCFARAQQDASGRTTVYLFSDQGLLVFDPDAESAQRVALPGDEPFPALVPESMPYERRDPAWVYFARVPDDGGGVYRLATATGAIEPLPLENLALPADCYRRMTRAELRRLVDERLIAAGLPDLETFVQETEARLADWEQRQQGAP